VAVLVRAVHGALHGHQRLAVVAVAIRVIAEQILRNQGDRGVFVDIEAIVDRFRGIVGAIDADAEHGRVGIALAIAHRVLNLLVHQLAGVQGRIGPLVVEEVVAVAIHAQRRSQGQQSR